jgi:adenylate cyclase class 2
VATHNSETEIKIRVAGSPEQILARIQEAGFVITKPRHFEANTVYDTPEEGLRSQGQLLRLREVGDVTILTFKGQAERGKHKSREEIETTIGDVGNARTILERLGYVATFRYEKYRTEFERPGENGIVTLDDTPIGWFMELEGESDWIDRTAGELGFREGEYVTNSYGSLYLQYCAERGIQPTHMVFGEQLRNGTT